MNEQDDYRGSTVGEGRADAGQGFGHPTGHVPTGWPLARIVLVVIAGGFALLGLLTGGVGSFLIWVGLALMLAGVWGVASGKLRALWLRSRAASGAALAAGFIVVVAGSGAYAAQHGSSTPVSAPSASVTTPPARTGPETTVESVSVVEAIPFENTTEEDPSADAGQAAVLTAGVDGEKTTVFHVTYEDGVEVSRTTWSETVTREPVHQVTVHGTKVAAPAPAPVPAASCDPNYTGACVPIDSDVDCAGGSGNGPSFVRGPVTVVGSDIYDLDRDGDGVGCD